MIAYRMRVYKPGGRQWQTHAISAPDDTTAIDHARKLYNELAADLSGPGAPAGQCVCARGVQVVRG